MSADLHVPLLWASIGSRVGLHWAWSWHALHGSPSPPGATGGTRGVRGARRLASLGGQGLGLIERQARTPTMDNRDRPNMWMRSR